MWFLGLFTICTGLFRHCVVKTFWHGESLTPHGEITHLFLRPSYHTDVTRLISLSYLYHTSDFQPFIYHTSGFFAICVSHTWFLCHMCITHPVSLPYVHRTSHFQPSIYHTSDFFAICISYNWFLTHICITHVISSQMYITHLISLPSFTTHLLSSRSSAFIALLRVYIDIDI